MGTINTTIIIIKQKMIDARKFSESKHATHHWTTRKHNVSQKVVFWASMVLSFKRRYLFAMVKKVKRNGVVLDLGSGNGAYAAEVISRRSDVRIIALDWSEKAFQSPFYSTERISRIVADAKCLPIKDGVLDAMYTIDFLGHIKNSGSIICKTAKLLRSGAPAFIHSEISDYRKHFPDRIMLKKNNADLLAEIDGHIGIKPYKKLKQQVKNGFVILATSSPRGTLGWLLGYPDKYAMIAQKSSMRRLYNVCCFFARMKKHAALRIVMQILNVVSNEIENRLHMAPGGSAFFQVKKSE